MSKQSKNKEKEQSAERFICKRKAKSLPIEETVIQAACIDSKNIKNIPQTFTGKAAHIEIFKYLHHRTYTVIDRWNEFTQQFCHSCSLRYDFYYFRHIRSR